MNFAKLFSLIKKKLSSSFVRNLGWLGGAQMFIRASRLIATVVLARFLSPYDYGLAALVLTTHEFTKTFSQVGITAKLIQVEEEKLEKLCNSSYWLSWVIFLILFVVQCLAAFPIAWFYKSNKLILPICALASIYLMSPLCMIQSSLIRRENRLKITATSQAIQLSAANILTALFAFMGMGMWAIVLPNIIAYPISVYIYNRNHSWRPTKGFTTEAWGELFSFGRNLLGIELLTTLRNNLDYLIVGRFLGIKDLGIYFFAFNAGLGISQTIVQSITMALFPHLCAVRSDWNQFKNRYFSSLKTISFIIIPFVLFQSSLAPLYVPIVFGQKWVVAIPVLMLICLSAIPRPFAIAASQLLMAVDKPNLSLRWDIIFTVLFAGGLLVGVQWQAIGVATAVLLSHIVLLPLFVLWATRFVFGTNRFQAS